MELLTRNYYWPGMTKFVYEYVDTCDICARTKSFPTKPIGPLQPSKILQGPWQIITSDFIVGLPKSDGYNTLLVTSDRFTKQVHITACNEIATADNAATMYIKDVFKHHGTPRQVITDRGPQFTSK